MMMFRGKFPSGANALIVRLASISVVVASCSAVAMVKAQDSKKDNPAENTKSDALETEWQRLAGTWVEKSYIIDGKKLDPGTKFTFAKKKLTMTFGPGKFGEYAVLEYEIEIDPKADPKVLWEMEPGGKMDDRTTTTNIYRFRGESLELCWSLEGKRPTKFDSSNGSKQVLITLEREKTDKPKPP
jgi:uncharacterized protein (TIGR03067 family)